MKTIRNKIEWKAINWKKINLRVWRIQTKIYNYSCENDKAKVQKLQKILIKLMDAKLLAVRKITQDNRGKRTAGIDGKKFLTPSKRVELASKIEIDGCCNSIKRQKIPKPGKPKEVRYLGIPTIYDRVKQALALLALEPEWEAKFEKNSYGFRPGR